MSFMLDALMTRSYAHSIIEKENLLTVMNESQADIVHSTAALIALLNEVAASQLPYKVLIKNCWDFWR